MLNPPYAFKSSVVFKNIVLTYFRLMLKSEGQKFIRSEIKKSAGLKMEHWPKMG